MMSETDEAIESGLQDLLCSSDKIKRIVGRFVATEIPRAIDQFCLAEAARGIEPLDLFNGLAQALAATYASEVARAVKPGAPDRFFEEFGAMLGEIFTASLREATKRYHEVA